MDESCDNCGVDVDKEPRVFCDDCEGVNEPIVRACDSFIVAVAAVAELGNLPYVWQALPFGIDFASKTRSEGWEEMRVLKPPPDED